MYRILFKLTFYFIILLVIAIIYLSTFGIKTSKFNDQIKENIKNFDERINLKLDNVYLKLDLSNFTANINTENPVLYIEDSSINLNEINTNLDIRNIITDKEAINNIEIKTNKNSIKSVGKFINTYKFNLANFFLFNQIKKGDIILTLKVEPNKNLQNKFEIYADGKIISCDLELLNNYYINNINLDFNYINDEIKLSDASFNFDKLKFQSENIKIFKDDKNYKIKGNLQNLPENINTKLINDIFFAKSEISFIENDSILESNTDFSFKINNKYQIKNLKISSTLNFDKLNFNYESKNLSKYIPDFKNKIYLKQNEFKINYDKNKTTINLQNQYSFDKKYDKLDLKLTVQNNISLFDAIIKTKNAKIFIPEIDFKKNKNKSTDIILKGSYIKNQNLKINLLSLEDKKNLIKLENLVLNKNYLIDKFDKITLRYLNENKKENKLSLSNNDKEIMIIGESFDGKKLINNLFESNSDKNFFNIFKKFDKKVIISIDKLYIDDRSSLNYLDGHLTYNNKKIHNGNLLGKLNNKNNFSLNITTDSSSGITTKILIDNPEPFIKRYKFIKGFKEGNLYYDSFKKNGNSKSNLRIYNFKIQEVPILAKLLTLASLQGIADVLTGEGIRFTELDMKFTNNKDLMTIEEMYGIGPAISLLMEGYIEKNKLVSLRGTLVPATTLNKAISNIPLIGNLLVGKKVGEGVFGVSFKIKGPPKDLKTSVNPIKTLTPRFIIRTLEKVKKGK